MPDAALRDILAAVGLPAPDRGAVSIAGADPVFPTPYRVGTAGAAALAATGIAAADLWRLRGGRGQRVSVDARAAAAAMRSDRYLRIDDKPSGERWDPISAFFAVTDGRWIRMHGNFPLHRAAVLRVLGVPEDRKAVARACAGRDGAALEDAIHAAGGCAQLVRSHDEWAAHPQAAALAAEPLLRIERIGDAPAQVLPPGDRPLGGVRVLDLTRVLAGPTCARTLAAHGADVLRITAAHLADSGEAEFDTGIGKLNARLDLRDATQADRLRDLVRTADVFSQGYRPGALAGRGFAPDDLACLRPGIVCVSLNGWGWAGPWSERRGFDSLVQAATGMAEAQGRAMAQDRPALLPVSVIDYVSGYLMAFGAMVALRRRAEDGGSWLVRVSLARSSKWIVDRGRVTASDAAAAPRDLPAAELARIMAEIDSPMGRIGHLRAQPELSETPPFWSRPPVPLGFHPPEWPPRDARASRSVMK